MSSPYPADNSVQQSTKRGIARALHDATSQTQKELFAARMLGAPAQEAAQLLAQKQVGPEMGGGVPTGQPSRNLPHGSLQAQQIAELKRQLLNDDTKSEAMKKLAELGRQMREQQEAQKIRVPSPIGPGSEPMVSRPHSDPSYASSYSADVDHRIPRHHGGPVHAPEASVAHMMPQTHGGPFHLHAASGDQRMSGPYGGLGHAPEAFVEQRMQRPHGGPVNAPESFGEPSMLRPHDGPVHAPEESMEHRMQRPHDGGSVHAPVAFVEPSMPRLHGGPVHAPEESMEHRMPRSHDDPVHAPEESMEHRMPRPHDGPVHVPEESMEHRMPRPHDGPVHAPEASMEHRMLGPHDDPGHAPEAFVEHSMPILHDGPVHAPEEIMEPSATQTYPQVTPLFPSYSNRSYSPSHLPVGVHPHPAAHLPPNQRERSPSPRRPISTRRDLDREHSRYGSSQRRRSRSRSISPRRRSPQPSRSWFSQRKSSPPRKQSRFPRGRSRSPRRRSRSPRRQSRSPRRRSRTRSPRKRSRSRSPMRSGFPRRQYQSPRSSSPDRKRVKSLDKSAEKGKSSQTDSSNSSASTPPSKRGSSPDGKSVKSSDGAEKGKSSPADRTKSTASKHPRKRGSSPKEKRVESSDDTEKRKSSPSDRTKSTASKHPRQRGSSPDGKRVKLSDGAEKGKSSPADHSKGAEKTAPKENTTKAVNQNRKCHMCNVVFTSYKEWQNHLSSDEHKKQRVSFMTQQSADKLSITKMKAGKNKGQPANVQQHCLQCQTDFTGPFTLHKCKEKAKISGTPFEKFYCTPCKTPYKDQKSYESHLRTITHQVNVKYDDVIAEREAKEKEKEKTVPAEVTTEPDIDTSEKHCEMCKLDFASKQELNLHKLSSNHRFLTMGLSRFDNEKVWIKNDGKVDQKVEYIKDLIQGHVSKLSQIPGWSETESCQKCNKAYDGDREAHVCSAEKQEVPGFQQGPDVQTGLGPLQAPGFQPGPGQPHGPGFQPGPGPPQAPGFQPGPPYAPGFQPWLGPPQGPGFQPGPSPGFQPGPSPGFQPGLGLGPSQALGFQPGQGPSQVPDFQIGQGPPQGQQHQHGPDELPKNQGIHTRLHLGFIPKELEVRHLDNYFSQFGRVDDVHINSNRHGFIEFEKEATANTVLNQPTHEINKILLTPERTKVQTKWLIKRLHLGFIPYKITLGHIKDYFSKYGKLRDVTITKARHGFVEFEDESAADAALKEKNHAINDITLTCQRSYHGKEKVVVSDPALPKHRSSSEQVKTSRLHLGTLPPEIHISHLEDYFGKFGNLVDVHISNPGRRGFIEFENESHANEVLQLKLHTVNGVSIKVNRTKDMITTKRLHLGRIPDHVRYRDLNAYFSRYGRVVHMQIMQTSRLGFVEFQGQSSADTALEKEQHIIKGATLICQRPHLEKVKSQNSQPAPEQVSGWSRLKPASLRRYFCQYGKITRMDLKHHHQGYLFLEFKKPVDSKMESTLVGPHIVLSERLVVKRKRDKKKEDYTMHLAPTVEPSKSVTVLGLKQLLEEDLREYFKQYGDICKIDLSQRSQNYCFIEFGSDLGEVKLAVGLLGSHTIKSTQVMVKAKKRRLKWEMKTNDPVTPCATDTSTMEPSKSFTVRGIRELLHEDLLTYFTTYGDICKIDLHQRAMDYCFIEFKELRQTEGLVGIHTIKSREVGVKVKKQKKKNKGFPVMPSATDTMKLQIHQLMDNLKQSVDPSMNLSCFSFMEKSEEVDSILMSNIPRDFTKEDIETHFKTFGAIDEVQVIGTKTKRFGFVKYKAMDSVNKALDSGTQMHGQDSVMLQIRGGTIECEREIAEIPTDTEEDKEFENKGQRKNAYFLNGVKDMHKETVYNYFKKYGVINFITYHKNGDQAIVEYFQPVQGPAANKILKDHTIDGVTVSVSRQKLQEKPKEVDSILMSKIPKDLTKEDIETHFQTFGAIDEVEVIGTKTKRFGYVKYKTMEAMTKVMEGQDSMMLQIKDHMVECERDIAASTDED